jgi:hypothetical protein
MYEGNLELEGKKLPRTLLGTSPFIGAAQFGHRARLYQLDLYQKPGNMAKIIKKSCQLGVRGIQLLPYPPLIEALKMAQKDGCYMEIVGTVLADQEEKDINLFAGLDASAMLLHAVTTDRAEWNFIAEKLESIADSGAIPGLVTHTPFRTTRKLLESPIIKLFQLYMIPVNRLGYLMDCDTHGPTERSELRQLIQQLEKKIIAKKLLAAGIMTPNDAFDYLKTLDYVDMVAVGIASEDEAQDTFEILAKK